MNASHAAFFERPDARPIKDVLSRAEMLPQYELLSRLEIPAVQAAVWEIEPIIEKLDPGIRNYAIQSAGALIGDLLTARGFRIARDARGEKRRGRVRKARFVKSGTIWELPAEPDGGHRDKVAKIMEDVMVRYRSTLTELAK
ncbi:MULTISPECIES: hypothetical protein [Methylorubrum]|jgi:hypothetical protein|uniref:hypothetical protein n=1 Tax=Methylorubrum TaxID=2282523 RepID=UPI001477C8C3|nr:MULTISPECIES: hypothetical protein [Methylorubrum]MBA9066844.1 hypothetical protein [Methylobacterium sp. RAS18]MDF9865021.1 hypothetical protein [Methylorubrum pseudosasae]MDH6638591.1 hypothetical protein [Methylobacterium sp. SuP10 SLI 274]MDH6667776.1 hypothetical protein [Methylorubrum zatmanii]MCP1537171.1 hypothetical protein [Methylorubrum extorquens]